MLTLYHEIIILIYHVSFLLVAFSQIATLCYGKMKPYRLSLDKCCKPVGMNLANLRRSLTNSD